jgi:hypothetical protein
MNKLVAPLLFLIILCMCQASYGAVPVVNDRNGPRFDRSRIPKALLKDFGEFEAKCTRCHTLERVASSFLNGAAPISGRPFDLDAIKGILLDMMRKSAKLKAKGQEISKEEIKSILALMKYFLDESVK